MATLGITSEAFYDLSPVEFYYALKAIGEERKDEAEFIVQTQFEAMRLQAVLLINHQEYRPVSKQYSRVEDLIGFAWDKYKPNEKQSTENMKTFLLDFADMHNKRLEKQKLKNAISAKKQLGNKPKMKRTKFN